ncbi:MAG: hypothetical protein ACYS1A_00845 [Planctomycetota bacterium]|jgi:hypothetical protein
MSDRKTLILIAVITTITAVACCVDPHNNSRTDELLFVDGRRPPQPQSKPLSLVVAVHGWVEKGRDDWPEDMAVAIQEDLKTDSWLCGYFDWSKGAATLNPTDAAGYAADIAGPALAEQILALDADLQHIHLIGHSGGCWVISAAAKILARKTSADIHLTFLDAYVPHNWNEKSLGALDIADGTKYWADHYYTRDYTLTWTQYDLTFAHNVDITKLDQGIKDHNFPWQWYYATITGKYPTGHFLNNRKLSWNTAGTDYGFARSKEALESDNWQQTLHLPIGNKAVIMNSKKPAD